MKKKFFTTLLGFIIAWSGVLAQKNDQSSGHLSLGVEFYSTTGFGLELATPLGSNFALRGGISLFPLNFKGTIKPSITENIKNKIDGAINSSPELEAALSQLGLPTRAQDINTDINTTGSLGLTNGKILIDFYPSAEHSFHITGGLYIGPTDLLKVEGRMDRAIEVLNVLKSHGFDFFDESFVVDQQIGYQLSGYDITDFRGAVKINSVKPYLGLGFGRAVPKSRVGVSFEIGAFYQGTPKITSDNSNIQKFVDDKLNDVTGVDITGALNNSLIYPVLSLKLNLRLF